jgi:SpoVK/Ycf46/Vps4 family AAA+-type ATPase
MTYELHEPGRAEQKRLWRAALGTTGDALNGALDSISAQFRFSAQAIGTAAQGVRERIDAGQSACDALWAACRASGRGKLDELARRIPRGARWDDLVLPEPQLATLRQIAAQVRNRLRVYDDWGFGRGSTRGLGVAALFSGESGTGKTLAAEVLASELNLDLYRIDLSSVVSKYIGETEKNLRRVFDAAEGGGAVLLFDEADALFGKRSEVKDSHDRYANIEVSYLLQRMETYRGLAILTTNLKSALDTAFQRRLRFIVHFPFPDAQQREAIWLRSFPASAPTADLDFLKLARLHIAGGGIRNVALNAAFLAADDDAPLAMRHLLHAAHIESAKLERPLSDTETRGWV